MYVSGRGNQEIQKTEMKGIDKINSIRYTVHMTAKALWAGIAHSALLLSNLSRRGLHAHNDREKNMLSPFGAV